MTTVSLPQVLQAAIQRALSEIHTCLPAIVESYDHTQQRASVQPVIQKKYRDGLVHNLPVIVNVPVVFPRTAMGSFTFPVNPGDYVMLTFSERAMERFLSLGGVQEPGDTRKFDLTDAIAMPGLYPFNEVSLTENNKDSLWVFKKNKVRLKDNGDFDLEVNNNASIQVKGNSTIKVDKNSTVNIQGNVNLSVGGDVTATIGGKFTGNISGDADITASNVKVTATLVDVVGDLNVSGKVNLGGGGPGIARLGDSVEVTVVVSGGSSAGSYTGNGTITAGSGNSTSS